MSGSWGKKVQYTIFGESHGKGIGITIDGLPPGFEIDLAEVTRELERRALEKVPYQQHVMKKTHLRFGVAF